MAVPRRREHVGRRAFRPKNLPPCRRNISITERGLLVDDLKDFVGEAVLSCADAFRIAVGQGKPSKAIVDYAEHNGVDRSDGCRGLNAVAGMLGSVSYAVLRNASCPVLIEK
ncbi:MAG: universal stress protein [Eggerthellaceae bacterium]